MSKSIKFIANNTEITLNNFNDAATFSDALDKLVEASYMDDLEADNYDCMTMLNDTDITGFVNEIIDMEFEDGDVVVIDADLDLDVEDEMPETAPTATTTIAVVVTAAGSLSPATISTNVGTNVLTACQLCKAILNMTDSEIVNAEKFVNDVVANNNTVLRDGDTVTVTVRCAGVKGSSGHYLKIICNGEEYSKTIQGALLRLNKRALINGLLSNKTGDTLDDYDTIIYDGCTLDLDADFTSTWLDAPMSDDLYIELANDRSREQYCASQHNEDDEDLADFEEDTNEEAVPNDINITLPGGVSNATVSIRSGETTVQEVVTSARVLALSGMNENQALNMQYTVNDVPVPTDYVLTGGDSLAMFTREAGVKGA